MAVWRGAKAATNNPRRWSMVPGIRIGNDIVAIACGHVQRAEAATNNSQ
jgi:hypothetical protein